MHLFNLVSPFCLSYAYCQQQALIYYASGHGSYVNGSGLELTLRKALLWEVSSDTELWECEGGTGQVCRILVWRFSIISCFLFDDLFHVIYSNIDDLLHGFFVRLGFSL